MANPLSSLLGGGSSGGGSSAMLPLMMAAMMQPTQAPPPPAQSPMGSPDQYKSNTSAGSPSFVSSATTAPTQGQTGGKTLLGQ